MEEEASSSSWSSRKIRSNGGCPYRVGSDAFPSRGTRAYPPSFLLRSNVLCFDAGRRSLLFSRMVELYWYRVEMGGEINDYRVVRTVDFKERFVCLASIIHRRYSCVYIYIYIVGTQWQFVCDTIDDEQRRYARFKRFRRGRNMCVVCVCVCVVPGARLLTTFSFDLRHALHL